MKGIDIFCASQASTAICFSMEEGSSSSPNLLLGSSPAIDRYNPIIKDSRRIPKPPCNTPQLPINPKPYKKKNKRIPFKENDDSFVRIKLDDAKKDENLEKTKNTTVSKSWNCTKPSGFVSPSGSTRYLLSENVERMFNAGLDTAPVVKFFPEVNSNIVEAEKIDEPVDQKPISDSPDQVVVLRVSLHCRGCEKKMRKHISKMEGVASFNIDFMAKKVTVTGNVTPLAVLSSISKVKNATLWTTPTISSSTSSTPSLNVMSDKQQNGLDKEGISLSMANLV